MKTKLPVAWDCQGNVKLEAFLKCPADEVLYGGAAGSAKSEGLVVSSIGDDKNNIFTNPNWKVLVLRRTFPELENSIILRSQALLHDKAKYNAVKHRWTVPGGGMIQYGHIKSHDDLVKHHSAEYPRIQFDELTTFTERMYLYMFSRCRSRDASIKAQIRAGTNPGNLGHAWVKARFLEKKIPRYIYHSKVMLPNGVMTDWSQCFIPANVFDNKFLMRTDPMYARRLMELPEIERQALLYGNWDIFSGQFFPEFTEETMIDDFKIPSDWPVWLSLDWGYATKCGVLFFTQDPESGVIYLFNELYVTKVKAREVSSMIKSKLGDLFTNIRGLYSDKRIMVIEDEEITTQEKFAFEGLYFKVVDTDRENGWHRTRELLFPDQSGTLGFRVFRSCANFIRTIPECIFDERHPEDMDKRGEVHLADSLRYFAVTRKAPATYQTKSTSSPMFVSPRTGYVGKMGGAPLLRNSIPRLTGLVKGANYFLDKPR